MRLPSHSHHTRVTPAIAAVSCCAVLLLMTTGCHSRSECDVAGARLARLYHRVQPRVQGLPNQFSLPNGYVAGAVCDASQRLSEITIDTAADAPPSMTMRTFELVLGQLEDIKPIGPPPDSLHAVNVATYNYPRIQCAHAVIDTIQQASGPRLLAHARIRYFVPVTGLVTGKFENHARDDVTYSVRIDRETYVTSRAFFDRAPVGAVVTIDGLRR